MAKESPVKPQVGDRIKTTGPLMYGPSKPGEYDPCSPPVGSTGTVEWVNEWRGWLTEQFDVKWDQGIIAPSILLGSDPYQIIKEGL